MGGRLKAGLCLAAMFAIGAAAGISWQRYTTGNDVPRYSAHGLQRMSQELSLSPTQRQQVEQIFQKAHERAAEINEEVSWDLAEVHRDSLQAIRSVLSEEQRARFDAWRKRVADHHGTHHHVMLAENSSR